MRSEYLAFGRPDFSADEIEAVTRVLRSGWVGMGAETIAFEKELEAYVKASHVVTVNSCTSALFLSALAAGVGPGDEVVCPSLTWCATANAALHLGATPVFCDVDRATMCVTPKTIRQRLTRKTRAVMVVHYGGLAADIDAIHSILPPGVAIIEDAAHAFGGTYRNGAAIGSSGNLTCFSFYANKNLSTGEGGAIASNSAPVAERLRSLRQNGLSSDAWKRFTDPMAALTPVIIEVGYKMNYTDLQASIGRVQLARLPEMSRRRRTIAEYYRRRIGELGLPCEMQQDVCTPPHARHLFVIALGLEHLNISRNEFLLALRNRNIGASVHYSPLHRMPVYRREGAAALPDTDWLCDRIITLPISATMKESDAEDVVQAMSEVIEEHRN